MAIIYTENLIPKMTSNTAPSGVASSSSANGTNLAWGAFDQTQTYQWLSAALTGWISYQFVTAKNICKYTIKNQSGAPVTRNPKTWTFEGSNDGTAWTVLDARTNYTTWTLDVKSEFTFQNSAAYTTYRINITANNGDASYLSIGEIEMMAVAPINKILLSLSDGGVKSINTEKSMVINTGSSVSFNNKVITAKNIAQSVLFKIKCDKLPTAIMDVIAHTNSGISKLRISIGVTGIFYVNTYYTTSAASINLQTNSPLLNICDGKWHDIAFTWDGTTSSNAAKLYVDDMNTPYTTQTVSNIQTTETTGYLTIGGGTGGSFNIKDFASLTRVFTTQELLDFKAGNLSLSTANMSVYFKFQDSKNGVVDNLVTGTTISGVVNNVDFVLPKLINLKSASEQNFLSYGVNSSLSVPIEINEISDINDVSVVSGSGKIFEHTADMSKRRIDKITLG